MVPCLLRFDAVCLLYGKRGSDTFTPGGKINSSRQIAVCIYDLSGLPINRYLGCGELKGKNTEIYS